MENIIRIGIYSGILTIIIIFIGILIFIEKGERVKLIKSECGVLAFISSILYMIVVFIIGIVISLDVNYESNIKENVIETEKEIVNLNIKSNVNGEINGSFFIGTGGVGGSINDEEYYYFYTKTDNRYKLEKVLAKDVELIEYDGIPKIVYKETKLIKERKRTNGVVSDFLKLYFNKEWEENLSLFDLMKYEDSEKEETIIYIPKDSIFTNFNPNLE
ncbi:hypothetical protein NSA50_04970 [Clostridium sp. DSM 100503]|uniref:hypothetical protein n=1 Tax=Clostridium sp. DSM 100503 TaxID=2963282 RepID=UPI00214A4742|nr:hypothetical protein [Clostridium sp. DSM 100503]MCR1950417.1 hypothetical protein [Clostridium sp. DSM 100503]